MKQKVCMLLSYLPFLDARLFECEAKSLVKYGYDVTIIAPRKNGFLYDIDGKPFIKQFSEQTFFFEGIKVVTYDMENRTENALTDPLFRLGLEEGADYYHAHELNSFYFGKEIKLALKKNGKGAKLIYDSRQLAPDPFSVTLREEDKQKWREMLLDSLKEADYTIAVSDSIKAWYLAMDPMFPVEVIYNCPPLASNYQIKGQQDGKFVAAHEGNASGAVLQKFYSITDLVQKEVDFHFKIIGGPRFGENVVVPEQVKNQIIRTGWVHYHSLPTLLSDVDIGLIDIDPTNSLNNSFAMPSKLFSYLNNGVPVITNKCSEVEKIINTYQCGLVLNKLNPTPKDYAEGLLFLNQNRSMLEQMSMNARRAVEEFYNWDNMEKRLISIFQSLESKQTSYLLS
ncbi:glycosyltransferase [Aquibacillus kalidii]|uniref:glycosyltransferase n=1 Tax=Aquibacillus kalidii TaxID=2762597 RepID=UPI001649084D|nr:glycosyltransferase [Aquibacillus kalidii]